MKNPIKKLFGGKEAKAKEISKTNVSAPRDVYNPRPSKNGISQTRDYLDVATVKAKGSPKQIIKATNQYGNKAVGSNIPNINITPKAGQTPTKINTYNSGSKVMSERQGTNLIGQPVTKVKYADGSKVKSTLTSKGVIEKTKMKKEGVNNDTYKYKAINGERVKEIKNAGNELRGGYIKNIKKKK